MGNMLYSPKRLEVNSATFALAEFFDVRAPHRAGPTPMVVKPSYAATIT
jgi:hypothetical protein